MTRSPGRDAAVALSLANLLWLPVWSDGVYALARPRNLYFFATSPEPARALLSILFVLSLAAVLYHLGTRFGGRAPSRIAFVASVGYAANAIRLEAPLAGWHSTALLGLLGIVVLAGAAGSRWRSRLSVVAYGALLCLSPFSIVTLTEAGSIWLRLRSASANAAVLQPVARATPERRLVVLVVDEFDYETAFEKRPPDLNLPAFDRLRNESWWATRAFPTTNATITSVPSMLSGKLVSPTWGIVSPHDLELEIAGTRQRWSELPSIFHVAREMGLGTAVIGWYHPYCRVFGSVLDRCASFDYRPDPEPAFIPLVFGQLLLNATPGSRHLGVAAAEGQPRWLRFELRKQQYERMLSELTRTIQGDSQVGLVYAHLPIPHDPYIFDRATRSYSSRGDYLGNLALSDNALESVLESVARASVPTALLVTSDHSNRFDSAGALLKDAARARTDQPSYRVPLALRFEASRSCAYVHEGLTRGASVFDVTRAYLSGQLATCADVSSVIDGGRS